MCPPFQLDLKLKSDDGGDISTYVTNGEWALIGRHPVWSVSVLIIAPQCLVFVYLFSVAH